MALEQTGFRKSLHWVIIVFLLITMVILQSSAIGMRSFWEDEAFTAQVVKDDPDSIVQRIAKDVHPPLYWLFASSWSKVFGGDEWGLKTFSLFCLGLVFIFTYKLALDLFDSRVALISVSLLVFSPLVVTYGHNARYYSLSAALSLLVVLVVNAYIKTNKWLFLGVYVLSASALLYTLYVGAALLLAINIWWFVNWLRQKKKYVQFLLWSGAQITVLLLYIPWFSMFLSSLTRKVPSDPEISNWFKELVVRIGYIGYAYAVGEFYSPINLLTWIGLVIVVGIAIFAFKHRVQNLWLLLLILVVSQIPILIASIMAVYPLSVWQSLPNRTFFLFPFFLIVLAYGINQLRGKWFWGALAAILIIYSVGIFNYFTNRQVIKPILIVPWREIFTDIQAQAADDAVVVCTNDDTACFYYQDQYGFDRFSPSSWIQLPDPKPTEVWWIQSHRGDFEGRGNTNNETFQLISKQYEQAEVNNFVPQDPGIAMLKARFLGTADYEHRVKVYLFVSP